MRYFLHLRFLGTNFGGWQKQTNARSVQESLEKALSLLLRKPIRCHGCGRTDAGVNGAQFVAHFDVQDQWSMDLVYRLNQLLKDDIIVYDIVQVDPDAHAQRDVTERSYHYLLHLTKDPFISEISSYYPLAEIDTQVMRESLQYAVGRHDFSSFCLQPNRYRHTHCKISKASLLAYHGEKYLQIQVSGDRFLRGMMRFIVQSLIELGTGKRSWEEWVAALNEQAPLVNRRRAYPQGLHLARVTYPYIDFQPRPIINIPGLSLS